MSTGGYAPAGQERPLAAYAAITGAFGSAFGATLLGAHRRGRLRSGIGAADIVLAGVATHKISRLLAKDKVTSFLRAPFTRFEDFEGQGEVSESPRGSGMQLAVGELAVCPYCLAQWVAAGLVGGLLHAPRVTRTVAAVYAAQTISDLLQPAYRAAEDRA